MAYSALLLALVALNVVLLSDRDGVDVILLRAPGCSTTPSRHRRTNLYTYQVVNKTGLELPLTFVADGTRAKVRTVGAMPAVPPGEIVEGALFLVVPKDGNDYPDQIVVSVRSGGEELKRITTSFLHPSN